MWEKNRFAAGGKRKDKESSPVSHKGREGERNLTKRVNVQAAVSKA